MRKFLSLLLLVLVMVSSLALADAVVEGSPAPDPLKGGYDDHTKDNGVLISFATGNQYVVLPFINRSEYYLDTNNPDKAQKTTVNVRTEAYIPCYLKMTVLGNQGKTVIESFGPLAFGEHGPVGNYMLAFDNEIGGFLNENWELVGHGQNAELAPGKGYYIHGCDIFQVDVYANDTFKYEVISAPLANINADTSGTADKALNLQMRSKIDNGDWGTTETFAAAREILIAQRPACSTLTVQHQFRVPYLLTTAHGKYQGQVTFKAYTI
mgnify:FL=1